MNNELTDKEYIRAICDLALSESIQCFDEVMRSYLLYVDAGETPRMAMCAAGNDWDLIGS